MHDNWKRKAIELDVEGTIISDRFDGIPCRQMLTTASARMASKKILNLWEVFMYSFTIAKELQQPWLKMVLQTLKLGPKQIDSMMRMSQMMKMHTITITTGDLETGMTASGMSVGLVHDVPTIAELLERLFAEIKATQNSLNAQLAD